METALRPLQRTRHFQQPGWRSLALSAALVVLAGLTALCPKTARAEAHDAEGVDDLPPPVKREGARWRAGIGFGPAGMGGDVVGVGGNLDLRFGRQFSQDFSAFLQARGFIFAAPHYSGAAYGGQLGLFAELTPTLPLPDELERSVLIAVGPAIDVLGIDNCGCASEGGAVGAEARLSVGALALPTSGLGGRRSNFFITLMGHPSWTWKGAFLMHWSLGLSFEAY